MYIKRAMYPLYYSIQTLRWIVGETRDPSYWRFVSGNLRLSIPLGVTIEMSFIFISSVPPKGRMFTIHRHVTLCSYIVNFLIAYTQATPPQSVVCRADCTLMVYTLKFPSKPFFEIKFHFHTLMKKPPILPIGK